MRKIIRDRYDEILDPSELELVSDEREYANMMLDKLEEELSELADSDYGDVGEFADVLEVLFALAEMSDVSIADILAKRIEKKSEKGGFKKGLILDRTTMHDQYGDESDHQVCLDCGFCIRCGDCKKYGCGKKA